MWIEHPKREAVYKDLNPVRISRFTDSYCKVRANCDLTILGDLNQRLNVTNTDL
jgi:hypothetical protein